jgi:hypothetical protein
LCHSATALIIMVRLGLRPASRGAGAL